MPRVRDDKKLGFRPTPGNVRHTELQSRSSETLKQNGYRLMSFTYHDVLGAEDRDLIAQRQTPTGLYLRAAADHVAVGDDDEFLVEFKTPHSGTGNVSLAAHAAAVHCVLADTFGVRCLYIVEREGQPDGGFWTNTKFLTMATGRVSIPNGSPLCFDIEKMLCPIFPRKTFLEEKTGGSQHPFLVLHRSVVVQLPPWTDLVFGNGVVL